MSLVLDCEIVAHRQLLPDCRRLVLAAPAVAEAARPGQFLHLRCGATADPLLRRPLSIHDVDRVAGLVTLLYRVVGRGTALLATRKPGPDRVNILGPLGRGFEVPPEHRRVALVGGGLGVAPLFFLARELAAAGREVIVFHGARTTGELELVNFGLLPVESASATDDGSVGYAGSVVELFGQAAAELKMDWVCAAGPTGMLRALAGELRRLNLPGEVSLEGRMGCGIGVCVCCNCRIGTRERWTYRRVCADGPVFSAEEVVWE
jgi:dihydroorotate dehydrogenase electron transfer subunit